MACLCSLALQVRVSQGLVYMGKGLMTLSPFHTDRQLLSGIALAGITSVLYCALDMKVLRNAVLAAWIPIILTSSRTCRQQLRASTTTSSTTLPVP